jgi:hypothetical protein
MAKRARSSKAVSSLCVLLLVFGAAGIRAGGALETVDITAGTPSPIAGQILARVIGIKWDARAIPVQYSVNTTLDPIPNPLGVAFLSVAAARAEMQASFNAWNEIKTSFIDMRITGTTANPGVRGFDFINELTFRTANNFTAIASSPSVTLIQDTTLVDGDRIDNDADSDVSDKISVVTDVDGDGDLEFPAGFYKAGTILDNDVQFNTKTTNGFRFTVNPAELDTVTRSVDLFAVAVHEFGHSHGLSHSVNNQHDAIDATGATMFPFIDTGDPASERAQRTLDIDDIAYSSYFYREGTARSGPAALQSGDIAFDKLFGLITGELRHGVLNQPIAGGSVFTVDERTQSIGAAAFSGTTQVSFNPATGGLSVVPDHAVSILDGNYVIPVLKGKYGLRIEPVDGSPVPTGSISFTAQIGGAFGQQNFNEEPADRRGRHGEGEDTLSVSAGQTRRNIDIVTSADINIDNFGTRDFIGFTGAPAGRIYAVRIPGSQVTTAAAGRFLRLKALAFHTGTVDASIAPTYAEAMLTTGKVNPDGSIASIQLARPLARLRMMVGQDDDLAPIFVKGGALLGQIIQQGIRFGFIDDLFLVLRIPTPPPPFPGVSGIPPLIGLDGGVTTNDVPILGFSYTSDDGGATFARRTDFNFRFSLRFADLFGRDGEDGDDSGDHDQ